jgi:RND family efflux transporter MFP subunit
VASARAASDAASVVSSYTRITAPFDGRITEKLVEPGNMAAPGSPLLRMESAEGFRVDVRLDEARAASLSPGQSVTVLLDTQGEAREGRVMSAKVSELARAIDADARTVLVKVQIDPSTQGSQTLRAGMFARIRVPSAVRKSLRVPTSAIVRYGQVASVFVIDQDRARVRLVQTGSTDGTQVEILAGLDAGELVVVSPPVALTDRGPVRVTRVEAQEASR